MRLILYKGTKGFQKGRHKLVRRCKSYWDMAEWINANVPESQQKHYFFKKRK